MSVFEFLFGKKKNEQKHFSATLESRKATYIPPVSSTQQDVLDYLGKNPQGITFIHGKAGCGKTYLINKIEAADRGCQVLTWLVYTSPSRRDS